jgi:signal transduction histidine kinase
MPHPANDFHGECILIHAPFGRDGSLIRGELQTAGFTAAVCPTVADVCATMHQSGCAVLSDEALTPTAVDYLVARLHQQPRWSDFPIIVMTSAGVSTRASRYRLSVIAPLGNVTLLERPLHPVTLLTALRAALRARRHQYQLRAHLNRIEAGEQALRGSEARFRFLSELGEMTRPLAAPDQATLTIAQHLGEYLGVSRCAYATLEPDSHQLQILHDYRAPGVASSVGQFDLASFGPLAAAFLHAGRTLILRDVRQELASEGPNPFAALQIEALICCPLVKDGRLAAMMAVHQNTPRDWKPDEVELVEEVAERCWTYIERERLLAELAGNNKILHQTNQDLSRVNRELEEFAYVASHDLQEPLRMVKIYTQLILKQIDRSNPALDRYAEFVQQGAARMEELIRDLLTYSRTVHNEGVEIGRADLGQSLAEATEVMRNRIVENGAAVLACPLPVVRGDAPQLAHVFQNLLSNSIKYRKLTEPPRIDIFSERRDGHWVIGVRDNGIGFDQCYAERIFGLFKRLHKDEYPGTGLGLAICQRIVERFGGEMWATSQPGHGSTFYFSLPAIDEITQ